LIDIDTKKDQPLPDVKVESIKITAPGTYELNLPSLFEREELIMAVKEGTYLIDLSSAFRKPKKD
jgi:predicted  nucleic acid-binding Zn-ribbon protein